MTEPTLPADTCRFPGCARLKAPAEEGVGRPPEYCQDPAHNRGSAWRARRAAAAAAADDASIGLERSVAAARTRVGQHVDQITGQVTTLTEALAVVLGELRNLGDPETTALQIDAVTAEADQRVAEAAAQVARAEADRRLLEQQRDEADVAAEEATIYGNEMQAQAAEAAAGQVALASELTAAQELHQEALAELGAELAASREETAAQHRRAQVADQLAGEQAVRIAGLEAELAGARESHLAQVQQFTAQLAIARADTSAQQSRAETAERGLGEVNVRVAILTTELVAAQQRVQDERAHTDARLADQRAAFEDRVAQLRADVERLTSAAAQPGNDGPTLPAG